MDLDTENRLAALLMEEARHLRAEADKDGVLAYLRKPTVRFRPNARFLTATVLGVQQANKIVEVDELWRAREKELELEDRLPRSSKSEASYRDIKHPHLKKHLSLKSKQAGSSSLPSSSKCGYEELESLDDGLQDEEIEEFLNSRVKRGRGAVGSRMDEPGPYPAHGHTGCEREKTDARTNGEWERRFLGPEKPFSLTSQYVADTLSTKRKHSSSISKKHHKDENSTSSKKHHKDEKHRKDEGSKKKRKEKSSRHHHH